MTTLHTGGLAAPLEGEGCALSGAQPSNGSSTTKRLSSLSEQLSEAVRGPSKNACVCLEISEGQLPSSAAAQLAAAPTASCPALRRLRVPTGKPTAGSARDSRVPATPRLSCWPRWGVPVSPTSASVPATLPAPGPGYLGGERPQ